MNGAHRAELDGCYDVDLPVTPFTNTLPIRRLPLHVGDTAELRVVYIDVETLEVRPDGAAVHRGCDTHRWAFEQLDDRRRAEFDVDEYGLVMRLPGRFRRGSLTRVDLARQDSCSASQSRSCGPIVGSASASSMTAVSQPNGLPVSWRVTSLDARRGRGRAPPAPAAHR